MNQLLIRSLNCVPTAVSRALLQHCFTLRPDLTAMSTVDNAPKPRPQATASATVTAPSSVSPLIRAYLVAYNVVSCLLWSYVWLLIVHHLLTAPHPVQSLYGHIHRPLQLTQSLACLEIVHSLLGLVRSPLLTTVLQVSSRLFIVWGVAYIAPPTRTTLGFTLATLSWATVEPPRYLYYALNLLTSPAAIPHALTWLRYSLFMVLYPTGITGEVWCVLVALPWLARHPDVLSVSMPNSWNFAFSYWWCCVALLALYVPGSPFMIQLMWNQRKKMLGGGGGGGGAGHGQVKKEL